MLIRWHDFTLALDSNSTRIEAEWAQLFAPFRSSVGEGRGGKDIRLCLTMNSKMPPPPAGRPAYSQPDLVVYPAGDQTIIHLPQLGQLRVDPAAGLVEGVLVPAALDVHGAFEDINAIGLAPLLRRHGRVLIHAFAAAYQGRTLLLVGESASGKTTTGLALLAAGWKLIANDSPMLGERDGELIAFAYPGLLSAHPDAWQRIPALRAFADDPALAPTRPGWKIALAAQELFASPWQGEAPVKAICLLSLDAEVGLPDHHLEPISPAVALGRLLSHSVDRWDQETLDFQIDLLQKTVQQVPTFLLRLGTDVPALPGLLEMLVASGGRSMRED